MRIFIGHRRGASTADILAGMFVAHREALKAVRTEVLLKSGMTAELAEILVELYLARSPVSRSLQADADGFLALRHLKAALGYSGGLLSRRMGLLVDSGWVEMKRMEANLTNGIHGNSQKVRLTGQAVEKVASVWKKFENLAERWLGGVSAADLEAYARVNAALAERCAGNLPEAELSSAEVEPEFLD